MNCCSNSGSDVRRMVMQPGLCRPAGGPGPVVPGGSPAGQQGSQMPGSYSRFPVGMGTSRGRIGKNRILWQPLFPGGQFSRPLIIRL